MNKPTEHNLRQSRDPDRAEESRISHPHQGDSRIESGRSFQSERFVDANVAAEFLSVKRKTILDWARAGAIPAHPFGKGKRAVWRFRISEIAGQNKQARCTMQVGSPEMARLERQ